MGSEKTGRVACCRVVSCRLCVNWPIDDTTRHDPFFRSLYNQMDQFTHMQHDKVWSSRQKAEVTVLWYQLPSDSFIYKGPVKFDLNFGLDFWIESSKTMQLTVSRSFNPFLL